MGKTCITPILEKWCIQVLATTLVFGLMIFPGKALCEAGSLADTNGEIVAWGDNSWGQCSVPAGSYMAISGGKGNSIAIRFDGSLAAWGLNDRGQSNVPTTGVYIAISAGGYHSLALKPDGTLVGWGYNGHNQYDFPTGSYAEIAAGYEYSLARRTDNTLKAVGENSYGQCNVPTGTYLAVASGGWHGLALKPDGALSAWGYNTVGQTNVPDGLYKSVACGPLHSLAVRTDGGLAAWGYNTSGQCNVPTGSYSAVAGGYHHSIALRNDGTIAAWGDNTYGACDVPAGVFVAIAAGYDHNLALRARTIYEDDLVVVGSDVSANLNRSITVAGDATIQTTMQAYHYPTMSVTGLTRITPTGSIQGSAVIDGEVLNQGLVCGGTSELPTVFSGPVYGLGSFTGDVTFLGGYAPGEGPSVCQVQNVVLGSGNVLTMELGGYIPGTEHDHLDIGGELTACGALDVVLINGFAPKYGDTFDLFDGIVAGHFSSVTLPSLNGGLYWQTNDIYGTGSITVVPEPTTLILLALGGLGMLTRKRRRLAAYPAATKEAQTK